MLVSFFLVFPQRWLASAQIHVPSALLSARSSPFLHTPAEVKYRLSFSTLTKCQIWILLYLFTTTDVSLFDCYLILATFQRSRRSPLCLSSLPIHTMVLLAMMRTGTVEAGSSRQKLDNQFCKYRLRLDAWRPYWQNRCGVYRNPQNAMNASIIYI